MDIKEIKRFVHGVIVLVLRGVRPSVVAVVLLYAPVLLAQDGTAVPDWVNITKDFTQQIGVHDLQQSYLHPDTRRCMGMVVIPTGDIFILTSGKGVCVSADQGSTWTVV